MWFCVDSIVVGFPVWLALVIYAFSLVLVGISLCMCRLRGWFEEAAFPKGKPKEEPLTHAQKRKRILAQRKANKKSFRRYCKEVRRWRECKHVLSEKYGTISVVLLCDPWVFRSLLFFHVLLT